MKREQIIRMLEDAGAMRTGHFELSSGRHSGHYVQCALILQHPKHAETLGRALADLFKDINVTAVVAPAMGGIIIGHEVARALNARSLFVERDSSGHMALRRGFELKPGERALVIEDVWTTGGSTRETIGVVEEEGGLAVAAGALIDRTSGKIEWNLPARALLELEVPSYEADDCPLCRAGGMPTRPGSRYSRARM
ncbi:MAG TPA: orotate phosphoribosyltransferase [Candidatus Acidoferrales bacterium]